MFVLKYVEATNNASWSEIAFSVIITFSNVFYFLDVHQMKGYNLIFFSCHILQTNDMRVERLQYVVNLVTSEYNEAEYFKKAVTAK